MIHPPPTASAARPAPRLVRSRFARAAGLALVLGLVAAGFAGCLDAKDGVLGRYDEGKDEFHFLNVYQRISGAGASDFDYLQALHKNRDHIITPPLPQIFGKNAVLRMSADQFAQFNLGDAPKALETQPSSIDLSAVRVLPGTFFLRDADTLCYYDQVAVPGKIVDQMLKLGKGEGVAQMTVGIDRELKRRQDGGKTRSWDEARKSLLEDIRNKSKDEPAKAEPKADVNAAQPAKPEDANDPLQLLDAESLGLLRKAAGDGTVGVTREKQVFRLSLPLSESDAGQVAGLAKAARDEIAAQSQVPGHNKEIENIQKLAGVFQVKAVGKAVEVSADVAQAFKQLQAIQDLPAALPAADEAESAKYKKTVAAARAKGLPIDEALKIEGVIEGFAAGSLKAYPSDQPVKPGEGLVGAQPSEKPAPN